MEAIGIDLGGSKMLAGVVDAEQGIHHRALAESAGLGQPELLDALAGMLVAAREARPDVVAAGLGIPCTIDQAAGRAIMAVNLPLVDVPIRELMAERLGLPVFIDNDANLAALAEQRFGAAAGAADVVMLTVGTGIGGGLILGGEIYRGSIGAGAELGHMVIDEDGPPCQGNCPNRGCLEALASGTALAREGRAAAERAPGSRLGEALAGGGDLDGRLVVEAALAGDETAAEVVSLIGRRLGVGIASLANIFNPEVVVVGGGVGAAGELLLEPARAELGSRALRPMNETPIVAARFGADAGMIGAAVLAMIESER